MGTLALAKAVFSEKTSLSVYVNSVEEQGNNITACSICCEMHHIQTEHNEKVT